MGDTGSGFAEFRQYLDENEYRFTEERKQIAEKVFSQDSHFEAEELLFMLRSEGKNVSRATIYRTLELLVNSGFVQKVDFGDGYSLYELSHGSPHHDHLYCRQCGQVIEFSNETIHEIQKQVCEAHDFKPTEFSHQIYGYCEQCRKVVD